MLRHARDEDTASNEFTTGDGRRLRIVDLIAEQTSDPGCAGVWLVEPA